VHGAPPRRRDIAGANQTGSGSEDEGMDAVHSLIVEEAIQAVFDMYRQINIRLAQARAAGPTRGEPVEAGTEDQKA